MNCCCQSEFDVNLARVDDYRTFKQVLDRGKHPAFIGRMTFARNSDNGGALIYNFLGEPVAVSLINPRYGILLALNVMPAHRKHGLGAAIVKFLMPNFARVIESKVEWFKLRGYVPIGEVKIGVRLGTQIMARESLFRLAGNLRRMTE